jgi:hypothetical protein
MLADAPPADAGDARGDALHPRLPAGGAQRRLRPRLLAGRSRAGRLRADPAHDFACTLRLSRRLYPQADNHRLGTLAACTPARQRPRPPRAGRRQHHRRSGFRARTGCCCCESFLSIDSPLLSTPLKRNSDHVPHQHPNQALQGHRVQGRQVHRSHRPEPQGQVGGADVLPGRLHLRVPHRAGRPGRLLPRVQGHGRGSVRCLHRHALRAQGLARHFGGHQEGQLRADRRPHRHADAQLRSHDRGRRPGPARHLRHQPRRPDQAVRDPRQRHRP